jgi:hypothetical protein
LWALLWPLFARSAWAQPATVVTDATVESAALALDGLGPASQCGGEHDKVRALLWPLFPRSVWAQPATVLAGTTVEGASLASVLSVCIGSASHWVGGHDRWGRCSGRYSLGRRWLSQPQCWRVRQVTALVLPLFASSAWE